MYIHQWLLRHIWMKLLFYDKRWTCLNNITHHSHINSIILSNYYSDTKETSIRFYTSSGPRHIVLGHVPCKGLREYTSTRKHEPRGKPCKTDRICWKTGERFNLISGLSIYIHLHKQDKQIQLSDRLFWYIWV